MLADGARETLIGDLRSPRDKMIVTWLGDGGFRVGELCGLHLIDLHLREKADCGECVTPHVHICHRELNPNKSRAKAKHPWVIENGVLRGGQIRRASPAMVHAYFEYLTTEYPAARSWPGRICSPPRSSARTFPAPTSAAPGLPARIWLVRTSLAPTSATPTSPARTWPARSSPARSSPAPCGQQVGQSRRAGNGTLVLAS
jgi:hypothetical protein